MSETKKAGRPKGSKNKTVAVIDLKEKRQDSKVARVRFASLLSKCIKDQDLREVVGQLTELAIGGDLQAIKLFLEYSVGKPKSEVELQVNENFDHAVVLQQISMVLGISEDDQPISYDEKAC